ncbi:hypothetical protein H5410_023648, partial [Solanum commersonii]
PASSKQSTSAARRATTSPANSNQRESQLRRATGEIAAHQQQRQQQTSEILASPFLSSPAKFEFKDGSQQIRPSSRKNVRRLQSGLEGIGLSRQAKTLDGVQIDAISAQITKLTAVLAESERRRVAKQESMSETVQQIKEQVMNLARRPTTSAPDDTDDESGDDDYVEPTP